MSSTLPLRAILPFLAIALSLVTLSIFTGLSLIDQQSDVSTLLQENVRSHRAAVELEECLADLIALEDARIEMVAVLHARVKNLIAQLGASADQQQEAALHASIDRKFAEYLARWQQMPAASAPDHETARKVATRFLEEEVLKPCQEFERYNTLRVQETTALHERVLRRLAWGLAVVGLLGGVSGIVLGYGVARGLSRSIRRLQVRLSDAAGKLGPALPEIVVAEVGDFRGLHAEVDRLTERIEQAVRDLQQREHEVLRAEQLAAVGQLAAGVAHEIRNPLTAIKLLAQAARDDGGGLTNDDAQMIEVEAARMECSLQTFLDFARPPKLERRRFPLNDLIHNVFDLLRHRAAQQRVVLVAPALDGTLHADPERLRQVVLNLALNALDAMPKGGTLTVSTRRRGGGFEIEVADTGPGISAAAMARLFQPFASTKETGLGLGLVISQRIVEDHAGRMNAANRLGGGASFFVTLPAETADADRAAGG